MTRHEWIEGAKNKLDEWDRTLTALERKGSSVKAEAESKYEEMLSDARRRVEKAKDHVDQAQDITGEAWKDMRESVEDAWREDKEAVGQALAELKS